MWQIWLIIAGICLIAEMLTVGFLVFWFAIGALITMILSFFVSNIVIQTTVFIISSTILIFATKPLVKKFTSSTPDLKTNVYSIIEKTGIVTQNINSLERTGQVKIDGEIWSAIGENDSDIPKGTQVKVLEIKGVKAIVTPK